LKCENGLPLCVLSLPSATCTQHTSVSIQTGPLLLQYSTYPYSLLLASVRQQCSANTFDLQSLQKHVLSNLKILCSERGNTYWCVRVDVDTSSTTCQTPLCNICTIQEQCLRSQSVDASADHIQVMKDTQRVDEICTGQRAL
jgi:hypothetical protein